jgi:hypothetical protein
MAPTRRDHVGVELPGGLRESGVGLAGGGSTAAYLTMQSMGLCPPRPMPPPYCLATVAFEAGSAQRCR